MKHIKTMKYILTLEAYYKKRNLIGKAVDWIAGRKDYRDLIEGQKEESNKWIQALSKFVVKFKLPTKFLNIIELNLTEIPKAPNGKILRHDLKVIVNQHYNKL